MASLCPVTFALADQHFPAILPTTDDGECIKIIRIEDGNLAELANAFLEIIKGFAVPAGSQVLLSSLSQLARIGVAGYAEELRKAVGAIKRAFGRDLAIIHGVPVLAGSVEPPSEPGWRSTAGLATWPSQSGWSR